MENKSHHHVHESKTFSKRSTWCENTLTLSNRALTKRRHKLIPRHCPQTLTARIVRKLYPRDTKHIRNQLRCDRNARTSNVCEKERYWMIYLVHVGVELLDKHERTCDGKSHNGSHPPLWMTEGRSVSEKSDNTIWRSKWIPRLEKFSENALWASSWWNRRKRGAESKDEEAPEWRGFQAELDLRLGAIDTTNVNKKRRRERKDNQKSPKQFQIYQVYWKEVRMHGKCMNMWHAK